MRIHLGTHAHMTHGINYCVADAIPKSSTVNKSVLLPGMGPKSFGPYPNSEGTESFRLPPTFMPTTPRSHPRITSPAPSVKENGSPRSSELSNFFPSVNVPV